MKFISVLFLIFINTICFAHKAIWYEKFLEEASKTNRNVALIIYNNKEFSASPLNSEVFKNFAKEKLITIETELFPNEQKVVEKIKGMFLRELSYFFDIHKEIKLKRIAQNNTPALAIFNRDGLIIYHRVLNGVSAQDLIDEIAGAIRRQKIICIPEIPLIHKYH